MRQEIRWTVNPNKQKNDKQKPCRQNNTITLALGKVTFDIP